MYDEKLGEGCNDLKTEVKLLFLRSMVFTYPVLAEAGIVFDAPLLCVVEEETAVRELCLALTPFEEAMNIVSLASFPKVFNQSYEKDHYGVHFFRYERGRYTDINIERVVTECNSIKAGIENQRLTVIIATAASIVKPLKCAGRIYFDSIPPLHYKVAYTDMLLGALLQDGDEIMRNVKRHMESTDGVEDVLEASWMIFHDILSIFLAVKKISIKAVLLDSIYAELLEHWEASENTETYVMVLYRALREGLNDIPDVYERKSIDPEMEEAIDNAVFYDETAYYFPDHMLQELCRRYMDKINYNFLKMKLAEAGILACEGASRMYYTKQVDLLTTKGKIIRKRRVKLLRDHLDHLDEFSLLEYLQMRGGESYADSAWKYDGNLTLCHNSR